MSYSVVFDLGLRFPVIGPAYYYRHQDETTNGPPPATETNPHDNFRGRHRPTKLRSYKFNTPHIPGENPDLPQNEGNSAQLMVWYNQTVNFFRYNGFDQPGVAPSADPGSSPSQLMISWSRTPNIFKFNTFDTFGPAGTSVDHEEGNIVIIAFDVPSVNKKIFQLYNFDRGEYLSGPPPVVESNFHFLQWPTYQQPTIAVYNNQSADTLVDQQNETHFVGKFRPTKLSTLIHKYTHGSEFDNSQPPVGYTPLSQMLLSWNTTFTRGFQFNSFGTEPAEATESDFIAKFRPTVLTWFKYNSRGEDFDAPLPPEMNPHFVGKFTPTKLGRFAYNSNNDFANPIGPQPDSYSVFKPKHIPTKPFILRTVYYNETLPAFVVPTVTHGFCTLSDTAVTKLGLTDQPLYTVTLQDK